MQVFLVGVFAFLGLGASLPVHEEAVVSPLPDESNKDIYQAPLIQDQESILVATLREVPDDVVMKEKEVPLGPILSGGTFPDDVSDELPVEEVVTLEDVDQGQAGSQVLGREKRSHCKHCGGGGYNGYWGGGYGGGRGYGGGYVIPIVVEVGGGYGKKHWGGGGGGHHWGGGGGYHGGGYHGGGGYPSHGGSGYGGGGYPSHGGGGYGGYPSYSGSYSQSQASSSSGSWSGK